MSFAPHTEQDIRSMLATIGVEQVEDLFKDIPEDIRLTHPLNVPEALDELSVRRHMLELSKKNLSLDNLVCFLGAGIYDHFSPSVVDAMVSRGEFLTAYTPYQPELSQGMLQALYEYQSLICGLTGMDMSNASMYDGSTAMAEAALTAIAATGRHTVLVSSLVHPNYRHVMRTYLNSAGYNLLEVSSSSGVTDLDEIENQLNQDCACFIVQSPNFLGQLEYTQQATELAHKKGALMIVVVDPISLALLKPPGEYAVDFVVGEGQSLGISMSLGGPLLGIFACKMEHQRRFPGRIVGVAQDNNGRLGYTMTLRTREQDIRREKATSNICTNESLLAVAAAVYMTAMGKHGLRQVAESCVQKSHYAAERLSELPGVKLPLKGRYFKEFVIRLPEYIPPQRLNEILIHDGILGGYDLGRSYLEWKGCMLLCVTEKRSKTDIDHLVASVKMALENER